MIETILTLSQTDEGKGYLLVEILTGQLTGIKIVLPGLPGLGTHVHHSDFNKFKMGIGYLEDNFNGNVYVELHEASTQSDGDPFLQIRATSHHPSNLIFGFSFPGTNISEDISSGASVIMSFYRDAEPTIEKSAGEQGDAGKPDPVPS